MGPFSDLSAEGFRGVTVALVPLAVSSLNNITSLIARFMGPTWGPSGTDSTQVGPLVAP